VHGGVDEGADGALIDGLRRVLAHGAAMRDRLVERHGGVVDEENARRCSMHGHGTFVSFFGMDAISDGIGASRHPSETAQALRDACGRRIVDQVTQPVVVKVLAMPGSRDLLIAERADVGRAPVRIDDHPPVREEHAPCGGLFAARSAGFQMHERYLVGAP